MADSEVMNTNEATTTDYLNTVFHKKRTGT